MALSRFVLPYADVGAGIRPSSGAKLFFYATGTSTPKNTFADSTGSTANANPVIANANGVFPAIFLDGIFNVALKDANDVQIWTADPVSTETTGNVTFSGVTISDDYATLKMLSTADASGFNETWLVESNNNLDLQHRNGSGGYLANLIRFDLKTTAGGGLNLMTVYGPASITGDLTLTSGDIAMAATKTVDGRDLSVDGAKLDSLGAQNVKLNIKVVDVGDWNMDSTDSVSVSHGLTLSKIRSMSVLIRNDNDDNYLDFSASSATTVNESIACGASNILLNRSGGSVFDSANYDSTSFNRGWVTIQYVD